MGLEKENQFQTFGLRELGIFDAPPSRALQTIVELCCHALNAPSVGLLIFDDVASELYLHCAVGLVLPNRSQASIPMAGSVAALIRAERSVMRFDDLSLSPHCTSVENLRFGARAMIGANVRGPADERIGVLAAMQRTPRNWSMPDEKLISDMAFLVSQQIMLKASFATLKILSAERKARIN